MAAVAGGAQVQARQPTAVARANAAPVNFGDLGEDGRDGPGVRGELPATWGLSGEVLMCMHRRFG